ncbi:MAG: Na(+)-translocating NADH-quinone reductase subunit A [Bacteroidota bacterium]
MSQTFKLKKGFDLKIAGEAKKVVRSAKQSDVFAIKPEDFRGLSRPKLLVKEGDNVKAGSALFFERGDEESVFTAPVSGEVIEIKRGDKRKVLEIKILADKTIEFETFGKFSQSDITNLAVEEIKGQLRKSGAWTLLVQRPYGVVANLNDEPKAIFISGFDSHPLAPDYEFLLDGHAENFHAGIAALKKLTTGNVHLSVNGKEEVSQIFAKAEGVQLNTFIGPHPAGNVGIQIHHLDPMSKGEIAWTIDPVGVAQIGKLFLEGIFDTSRLVAITGSQIKEPAYVKTFAGACFDKLLDNQVLGDHNRFISGNVLTGQGVGSNGFMGYYDHQITVIPEGDEEEFLGWIKPSTTKLSYHRAFGLLSFLNGNKDYNVNTNTYGEHRNFVVTGSFEDVIPMDVLPMYLFKAIMAEDYEDMEALGIYELIEEDVALCEFIDVSKNPLQEVLREGLELMKEG